MIGVDLADPFDELCLRTQECNEPKFIGIAAEGDNRV